MCQFVSAIKKGDQYLFVTDSQLWNTEKGELTRKHEDSENPEALCGHGAVRFFYGMDCYEGKEVEFTDFSSPKNFPEPIRKAILSGAFGRLGQPVELLAPAAQKTYNETVSPARKARYETVHAAGKVYGEAVHAARMAYDETVDAAEKARGKAHALAWKVYIEAIATKAVNAAKKARYEAVNAAWETYDEAVNAAGKVYDKAVNAAQKAQDETVATARRDFGKTTSKTFWSLFADPENRVEAWRIE